MQMDDFRLNVSAARSNGNGTISRDDIKCDDCGKTRKIREWRWCKACERVLCECCCIEGHRIHHIESYAIAISRSDESIFKADTEARNGLQELRDRTNQAEELSKEIVSMLNAVKREMQSQMDEGLAAEETIKEHLSFMEKLQREPLNAKNWADRQNAVAGLDSMLQEIETKQVEVDSYLKTLDLMVDESERKMAKLSRKEPC